MLGGIGSFFKGLFSGGSSGAQHADSSGGDTSGKNSQMEVSAEVGVDGGDGGGSSLVQSLTRQSQTSSLPPPPPLSRTTGTTPNNGTQSSASANVAARDGIDRASATAATLQAQYSTQIADRIGAPPIPPGRIPTLTNATPDNTVFRQVVDTRGINPNAPDVNRQVAYQSLLQLGFSEAQANTYLRDNPGFTIRQNSGTGNEANATSTRTQAATGSYNNEFTAETLRGLQNWLSGARDTDDYVINIGGTNRTTPGTTTGLTANLPPTNGFSAPASASAPAAPPRSTTAPVTPSPASSPFATNAATRAPNPALPPPPSANSTSGANLILDSTGTFTRQPLPTSTTPQRRQNTEGISSFAEGLVLGNFSDNNSWSAIGGQTVAGLIPYYGQIADARDIAAAATEVRLSQPRTFLPLLIAGVAVVPGLDFLKAGSRLERKAIEDIVKHGIGTEAQSGLKALSRTVSKEGIAEAKKELVTLNVARAEVTARLDDHLASGALQQNTQSVVKAARNSLEDHLQQKDLVGALRDVNGKVVRRSGDGYPFQHLTEVRNTLNSLESARDGLIKELRHYQPDSSDYKRLSADIDAVSETIRRTEEFLKIK